MSAAKRTNDNNLVELLDRVIDKGVVVAGDVRVSVAGVELIYINLRALIASSDSLERPTPPLVRPASTSSEQSD
ncbi:MAG: gas vesicle protein [Deinococcota bacterium]